MSEKDRTVKNVEELKRSIDDLLKSSKKYSMPLSPQKAMVYLTRLHMMDITWEMLMSTKVGYSVNELRLNSSNGNVKVRGKQLLRKWKELEPKTSGPRQNLTEAKSIGSEDNAKATDAGSNHIKDRMSSASEGERSENNEIWSVRFAADEGLGLKLIFAKIKSSEAGTK